MRGILKLLQSKYLHISLFTTRYYDGQELNYSIVPLQLIRHLSLLRKHLSRMKKIWNEEMENNGQEGTPGRNRISRNLVPYTLEVSWKDIVNHFCVLIGWARWKRKWHLCFHFKKMCCGFYLPVSFAWSCKILP